MEVEKRKFKVAPGAAPTKFDKFSQVLVLVSGKKIGIWTSAACLKSEVLQKTLKIVPVEDVNELAIENEILQDVVDGEILISDSPLNLQSARVCLEIFNRPRLYVTNFLNILEAFQTLIYQGKELLESIESFSSEIARVDRTYEDMEFTLIDENLKKLKEEVEKDFWDDLVVYCTYFVGNTPRLRDDFKFGDFLNVISLLFELEYFYSASIILQNGLRSFDLCPVYLHLDELFSKIDFEKLTDNMPIEYGEEKGEELNIKWLIPEKSLSIREADQIIDGLWEWELRDVQFDMIGWDSPGLIPIPNLQYMALKFPDGINKKDYLLAADFYTENLLEKLDLSESYVTGEIIPAMIRRKRSGDFREYLKLVFPTQYTITEDPKFGEILKSPYEIRIVENKIISEKKSATFRQIQSDHGFEIVVDPTSEDEKERKERYRQIVEAHITLIRKIYPDAATIKVGDEYTISGTPRKIEISLGNLTKIAKNPISLHRGLITGNGKDRLGYLFATSLRSLIRETEIGFYPPPTQVELFFSLRKIAQIGYLPELLHDKGLDRYEFFTQNFPLWAAIGAEKFDIHNLEMSRSLLRGFLKKTVFWEKISAALRKKDEINLKRFFGDEPAPFIYDGLSHADQRILENLAESYHMLSERKYVNPQSRPNLMERARELLAESESSREEKIEIDEGKVTLERVPGSYSTSELKSFAEKISKSTGRKMPEDNRKNYYVYIKRYLSRKNVLEKLKDRGFNSAKLESYSEKELDKFIGDLLELQNSVEYEIPESRKGKVNFIRQRLDLPKEKKSTMGKENELEPPTSHEAKLRREKYDIDLDLVTGKNGEMYSLKDLQKLTKKIEKEENLTFVDKDSKHRLLDQLREFFGLLRTKEESEEEENTTIDDLEPPTLEEAKVRREKYDVGPDLMSGVYYQSYILKLVGNIEKREKVRFISKDSQRELLRQLNKFFFAPDEEEETEEAKKSRKELKHLLKEAKMDPKKLLISFLGYTDEELDNFLKKIKYPSLPKTTATRLYKINYFRRAFRLPEIKEVEESEDESRSSSQSEDDEESEFRIILQNLGMNPMKLKAGGYTTAELDKFLESAKYSRPFKETASKLDKINYFRQILNLPLLSGKAAGKVEEEESEEEPAADVEHVRKSLERQKMRKSKLVVGPEGYTDEELNKFILALNADEEVETSSVPDTSVPYRMKLNYFRKLYGLVPIGKRKKKEVEDDKIIVM